MERLLKTIHGGILAFLLSSVAHAEVAHLGEAITQGYAEQAATYRKLKQQLNSEDSSSTAKAPEFSKSSNEVLDPLEVRIIPKSFRKQLKIARTQSK